MAEVAKLRTRSKGEPPKRSDAPGNTRQPARDKPEETTGLNLRVPVSVYEAFSEEAGRRHGFKKGSKLAFFLEMWESYQNNKST